MHPTIRSALVLLAGVIVSVLVVILMDTVAGNLYPLPPVTDLNDQHSLRTALAAMPAGAAGWAATRLVTA